MFEEYREPRYAPPPLLRRMVTAGLHRPEERAGGFMIIPPTRPAPIDLGL